MSGLVAGALFGALGVGAGAFGAHALADRLEPDRLEVFQVAVRYQMYHALALLLVGYATRQGWVGLRTTELLWIGGVVLFSGSLYGLALGGPRWLGPVTPLGGTLLIAGWVALAWAARGPVPGAP